MKRTGKRILSVFLTLLLAGLPLLSIPALAVIVPPENVVWTTVPTSTNGQEPAGLNPGDPWLDLAFYINGSGMDAAQEAAWLARNNSYTWQFDFDLNYVRCDHNDGTEEVFNRQSGWIMAIREAAAQPVMVHLNTAGLQVGDYYLDMQGYLDDYYDLFVNNGYAGLDRTEFDSAYSSFTYRYNPTGNICRWQMQGAALPEDYTGGLYLPQYAIHAGGSLGQQMLWQCEAAENNIHVATAEDVANSPWTAIPTSPNMLERGEYYLDFAGLGSGSTFQVTNAEELQMLNDGEWYVDHAAGLVAGYITYTAHDNTLGNYTVREQTVASADLYQAVVQKTGNVFASGYCGGEDDGTNLKWELTFDGVLTISGRGRMADYDYYDNTFRHTPPWKFEQAGYPYRLLGYSSVSELTADNMPSQAEVNAATRKMYQLEQKIVVEEGVTYIGQDAFCNWMGYSVSLPSSLTEIGPYSFRYMFNCKELTLPEGLQTMDLSAVTGPHLNKVTLPGTVETVGEHNFDSWNGAYEITGENVALENIPFVVSGWTDGTPITTAQYLNYTVLNDLINFYTLMLSCDYLSANPPADLVTTLGSAEEAADYIKMVYIEWELPMLRAYGFTGTDSETLKTQILAAINDYLGLNMTADDFIQIDFVTEEGTFNEDFIAAVAARCGGEITDVTQNSIETLQTASLADLPANFTVAPWNTITVSCTDTWNGEAIADAVEDNDWGFFYVQHSFDAGEVTTPPTCGAEGVRTYTCADCGKTVTLPEPATGEHQHLQEAAETAATATQHGFTAGVQCTDCGTWISGHEVIHNTLGARTVLAQPTEDSEGEAIIVCTVCGERGLYAIEKLPHNEQSESDGTPNVIERIHQAIQSFVSWMLRLIRWLGGGR